MMNYSVQKTIIFLMFCCFGNVCHSQYSVAITIDDIPNTRKFERDNYSSKLLNKLDSLSIPISIFINEGLIYKTDSTELNKSLLYDWMKRKYVTLGNHTYNHSRYSEVGLENFKEDIVKGEIITRKWSEELNKPLEYFRFPFNDLGLDSIQHLKINSYLSSMNYRNAPFTVESSDWMFNYLYEYYLKNNQKDEAEEIANTYIEKTLEYFDFFNTLVQEQYSRPIQHIYLCHDNTINADYMDVLVSELKKKGYSFISLDEAMQDPVYSQEDLYNKKWGISWLYRWMPVHKDRIALMKSEPEFDTLYNLYEEIVGSE